MPAEQFIEDFFRNLDAEVHVEGVQESSMEGELMSKER